MHTFAFSLDIYASRISRFKESWAESLRNRSKIMSHARVPKQSSRSTHLVITTWYCGFTTAAGHWFDGVYIQSGLRIINTEGISYNKTIWFHNSIDSIFYGWVNILKTWVAGVQKCRRLSNGPWRGYGCALYLRKDFEESALF